MDATSSPSSKPKRLQLDARSQLLVILVGLFCVVPIIIGAGSLPDTIENAWCPLSTFRHGQLLSGIGFFVFGLFTGILSLVMLPTGLLIRYKLLRYSEASDPVQAGKYNAALIISSILGLLISGTIFLENAAHFFCLTPNYIVIRSGYFDTPRTFTWDDISTVRAWCWTARPRGGRPYLGSTLTLLLTDGEALPIGLVDRGRILMQDYEQIRKSLEGEKYRYYVNSTVNPESCPSELYPLLWYWQGQ
jgi:hypothetical protein